ncbi:MAG: tetratricopeptide repeat protein [Actinomycetota bacterium]|nr:tetratricopeptide repeat protein [Actinomycetota bacterium]
MSSADTANAYDHLRRYTELVANNAWAWCWLGMACTGCELFGEAHAAYERAIELDDDEETGAAELLAELDGEDEDVVSPSTPVAEAAPSDPQFLRLSDGRSFFLGARQEVDTAFGQIIACTGGSSGGGRWSRMFGLQPELFVEASDFENFKGEANDLLVSAGLVLEDEASRLLERLGSL